MNAMSPRMLVVALVTAVFVLLLMAVVCAAFDALVLLLIVVVAFAIAVFVLLLMVVVWLFCEVASSDSSTQRRSSSSLDSRWPMLTRTGPRSQLEAGAGSVHRQLTVEQILLPRASLPQLKEEGDRNSA